MTTPILVGHAHDLVRITGADTVPFLDGQVSQDVAAMPAGSVARSFLLEPRGKVVALLWLLRGESEVLALCDPDMGERVEEALQKFLFRVDAAVEAGVEPVSGVWGRGAADVLAAAGVLPGASWGEVGGAIAADVSVGGLERWAVAGASAAALTDAGARPADDGEAAGLRIEAGEPTVPEDVDDSVIPQESGLVSEAVSFTKGCYLGQELVARIDSRGRVNRHLRGLVVSGGAVPPPGAAIEAGGESVGAVGTSAVSEALGGAVALALVRREVAPGDRVVVRWDGHEADAEVRSLPLRDFSDG
jgi:folate-binding protein YgfZ